MSRMFEALHVGFAEKSESFFVMSSHETTRNDIVGSTFVPNYYDHLWWNNYMKIWISEWLSDWDHWKSLSLREWMFDESINACKNESSKVIPPKKQPSPVLLFYLKKLDSHSSLARSAAGMMNFIRIKSQGQGKTTLAQYEDNLQRRFSESPECDATCQGCIIATECK